MEPPLTSLGIFAILGLGLIFGVKHATEVDHVVAVSTIVSEHRNILRSALVGGLWGAGHTVSLIIVGALVLVFRITIPVPVANWLEFGVALMIIALGFAAMMRVLRRRSDVHLHRHDHGGQPHLHIHFHERGNEHGNLAVSSYGSHSSAAAHSHAISRLGSKPFFVGAMHGLAGSAALTLLVLTQIQSLWLGLLYLAVFGVGSTLGMLLMSGLIGLPFALSGRRLTRLNHGLQTTAGGLSIAFGLWYAYQTVITNGLWRLLL
jgi:ABC-type nickel/cobalt efflux system permease component RcnA